MASSLARYLYTLVLLSAILCVTISSPSSSRGSFVQHPLLGGDSAEEEQEHAGINTASKINTNKDDGSSSGGVSTALFSSLERLARLVDISYCVGTTGVSPPFSCASRCRDFPRLRLVATWNTGILMSDSCGYVAVDPGIDDGGHDDGEDGDKERGSIIIAFRGTYSISNTVVDLSTVPQEYVPYPEPEDGGDDDGHDEKDEGEAGKRERCYNCTVHMGFLTSWRHARELVLPALKEARARHPSLPVHLVGHSLGGAVAALAALELKVSMGLPDIQVTTFGEPRVGNQGLASFIDRVFDLRNENDDNEEEKRAGGSIDPEKRAYRRVTHANDPVPLLPLSEWGYRSHAGEIFIAKADLSPAPEDLRLCIGDADERCSSEEEVTSPPNEPKARGVDFKNTDETSGQDEAAEQNPVELDDEWPSSIIRERGIPTRFKLWQLFFAHRDYFWRLGLCVPGGDPFDWGRERYNYSTSTNEL